MTVLALAVERVTVNCIGPAPSSTGATAATDSSGGSSLSRMVPVAVLLVMGMPVDELESRRVNVSSSSSVSSWQIGTETVPDTSPAKNVNVPDVSS